MQCRFYAFAPLTATGARRCPDQPHRHDHREGAGGYPSTQSSPRSVRVRTIETVGIRDGPEPDQTTASQVSIVAVTRTTTRTRPTIRPATARIRTRPQKSWRSLARDWRAITLERRATSCREGDRFVLRRVSGSLVDSPPSGATRTHAVRVSMPLDPRRLFTHREVWRAWTAEPADLRARPNVPDVGAPLRSPARPSGQARDRRGTARGTATRRRPERSSSAPRRQPRAAHSRRRRVPRAATRGRRSRPRAARGSRRRTDRDGNPHRDVPASFLPEDPLVGAAYPDEEEGARAPVRGLGERLALPVRQDDARAAADPLREEAPVELGERLQGRRNDRDSPSEARRRRLDLDRVGDHLGERSAIRRGERVRKDAIGEPGDARGDVPHRGPEPKHRGPGPVEPGRRARRRRGEHRARDVDDEDDLGVGAHRVLAFLEHGSRRCHRERKAGDHGGRSRGRCARGVGNEPDRPRNLARPMGRDDRGDEREDGHEPHEPRPRIFEGDSTDVHDSVPRARW